MDTLPRDMLVVIASHAIDETCALAQMRMTCRQWDTLLFQSKEKKPRADDWIMYAGVLLMNNLITPPFRCYLNHSSRPVAIFVSAVARCDRPDILAQVTQYIKYGDALLTLLIQASELGSIRVVEFIAKRWPLLVMTNNSWCQHAIHYNQKALLKSPFLRPFLKRPRLVEDAVELGKLEIALYLIEEVQCPFNKWRLESLQIRFALRKIH